jgi:hypothetical protein
MGSRAADIAPTAPVQVWTARRASSALAATRRLCACKYAKAPTVKWDVLTRPSEAATVCSQRTPRMYSAIAQAQSNLGPQGLIIEFLITVVVIPVGTWLLFKKRSSVFWKMTDYSYIIFTIVGGTAAAADIAISNWTKEMQQIQTSSDELLSHLSNYVDVGVSVCNRSNALRDARNSGIIAPQEIPGQQMPFGYSNEFPNDWSWQFFALQRQIALL